MPEKNGPQNGPQIQPAKVDAFAVIVSAQVPLHLLERMKAGNLKPSFVVFEQATKSGLTAGEPVSVPVRDLLPEEAIAVIQRAMGEGQVEISVAFNPAKQVARVHRI